MTLNKNINPYYNDFDATKNFLQQLYVPSRAVQARELSQLQDILQHQLKQPSDHLFKDGSSIIDANVSVNFEKTYMQLDVVDANTANVQVDDTWIGRIFEGETSGATCKVTHVNEAENILYFDYYGGTFQVGENIDIDTGQDTGAPSSVPGIITELGRAMKAAANSGVIYAQGYFIVVDAHDIIIKPKGVDGDYFVGYEFTDTFVTENEDSSLYDPANNSTNVNAPGAHRYKATMQLVAYEQTDANIPDIFYSFLSISDAQVTRTHNSVQYADILDLLADRTYDESGDYTTQQFPLILEQHETDDDKINIILEAGEAYVRGYRHETIASTILSHDKPRTTKLANNVQLYSSFGTFFIVDSVSGGVIDTSTRETVQLFSAAGGAGSEIEANEDIAMIGMYNIGGSKRVYLSGLSKSESVLRSVRSIVSGAKIINVKTKQEDTNSLIGEKIDVPMYGISPNPAPIFNMVHGSVKDVVTNETIYNSQISLVNFTNKVSSDFVIEAADNYTNFLDNGAIVEVFNGSTDISGSVTAATANNINGAKSTLTIQGLGAYSAIDIIVNTTKVQANPKTKTLATSTAVFTTPGGGTFSVLPHTDIFEITAVLKDTVAVSPSTITLDNGQRDYFYDYGRVEDLEDATDYEITYTYFQHTGTGDYFSADSYVNTTNTNLYSNIYSLIPYYVSEDGLIGYDLRDTMDFRPSVDAIASGVDIVTPESPMFADYNYYLPRIDKIYINQYGEFGIIKGVSSDSPEVPNDKDNTMTLYVLNINPYMHFPEDLRVDIIDTRNYTMRDIGDLEKRIENLEYYTSLSLLESKTDALTVVDSLGNEKFKNGIFVDNFTDHELGDYLSAEYRCALDVEEGELRCEFSVDSVDLIPQEKVYTGAEPPGIPGLRANENTITLDYSEINMIDQPKASSSINVNPYSVFVWYGDVKLIPPSDNWIDTVYKPTVTVHLDTGVQAWRHKANFMGIQWDSWRTIWSGKTTTKKLISSTTNTWVDRTNWHKGPHGTWLTNVTETTNKFRVTTTTKTGQQRVGKKLVVNSKTIKRSLGEKVVNVSIIPYIRARTITFDAEGLKPETLVSAFFDGVDVTAKCTSTVPAQAPGILFTDQAGRIKGVFAIEAGQFKTGRREFVLTDEDPNAGTEAKGVYHAEGLLQTKQRTILSTEVPVLSWERVTQNRIVTNTSNSIKSETTQKRSRPYDPVAESFFVDEEGGVFISSVEVFFETKDANLPVSLEIVENETGFPSIRTLPFSRVLKYPADISVSADSSVSTKFTFSDPIYLMDRGDYSIVLKSNSNEYNVFVGEIGKVDILTDKAISEQPYIGSLFKSQNAFTWNADQFKDLKFKINRCSFVTAPGNLFLQSIDQQDPLYSKPVTTMMPNIDSLVVDKTNIELFYQYFNSDAESYNLNNYTECINKENIDLSAEQEVTDAKPVRIVAQMSTEQENVSPVVNRNRSSITVVNNLVYPDFVHPSLDDAGVYISKTTTLANSALDLRVLVDVKKPTDTDVDVYYRTGRYIPRYVGVDAGQTINEDLVNETCFVYTYSDAGVITKTGSAVPTRADQTNNRLYLKQISNIASFDDQGNWTGLDATYGIFISDDLDMNGITIPAWLVGSTYNTVETNSGDSYVLHNGSVWRTLIDNNIGNTPSETSTIWEKVTMNSLITVLVDNEQVPWRPMVIENQLDPSVDTTQFVEYTFVPEEEIWEEFTQFAVKLEMKALESNSVNIPHCSDLRVLALT